MLTVFRGDRMLQWKHRDGIRILQSIWTWVNFLISESQFYFFTYGVEIIIACRVVLRIKIITMTTMVIDATY